MYTHEPAGYDCPFCRIVRGDFPETGWNRREDIVLRAPKVTAFVSPVWWPNNPGHVLIVSNKHYENLYVLPTPVAAAIHEAALQIALAMKATYQCAGISTRQHNEPAGNQDVWHYHLHLFPRYEGDDLYLTHHQRRFVNATERIIWAERLRTYLKENERREI